jgi:hypothetical protein
MLPVVSQDVMNFDDLAMHREVSTEALDFSKLHSFCPVMLDQSRMTSPHVDVVATMSPTAFVAIVSTADLWAKTQR